MSPRLGWQSGCRTTCADYIGTSSCPELGLTFFQLKGLVRGRETSSPDRFFVDELSQANGYEQLSHE